MSAYNIKQEHRLKEILSLLMEECDIDDATLSRETGIPASTISRMRLNSNANPTASTLVPISKYFSISINQLLGDEPLPKDRLPGTQNPTYFTSARMPIIEWDSVIDWINQEEANIKEKFIDWISTEKEVGARAFALIIPTDSFGLAFRKGSTIIIDPDQKLRDGDLILIKAQDDTIFLKQFLVDGKDIYIRSVNPEIKGITQLTAIEKIIGIVIETRFSLQRPQKNSIQAPRKSLPILSELIISKSIKKIPV